MTGNKAFYLNLILKSLRGTSSRVGIIAICIMLGSCVCAAFINVYLDIDAKVSKELKSYGANLIISPADPTNSEYISQSQTQQILQSLKNEIKGYSEYLFTSANIGTANAIIMGTNFSDLKSTKPFLEVREGAMINVDFDDKNVLLGIDLAKQAGYKAGDSIDINSPNGIVKVKIKGLVASGDKEDSLLITSLSLAQKLAQKQGFINYAEAVALGSFDEVKAVADKFNTPNISGKVIAKVSKQEGFVLNKIKLLMALISLVILLITSMCVNTTLSAILLARSKEVALLRALGASKEDVLKLFGGEILITALISALVGALLGYALAQVLGLAIFDAYIDFRIASLPIATAISLAFAGLACIYPIRRALNLKMADILRGE